MLNSVLETNHEEIIEYDFKHTLLEAQIVKKNRDITSADALSNMIRLVLGCEDAQYKISLAESPNSRSHPGGGFGGVDFQRPTSSMQTKTNFWEEDLEIPLSHTYSNNDDLK